MDREARMAETQIQIHTLLHGEPRSKLREDRQVWGCGPGGSKGDSWEF